MATIDAELKAVLAPGSAVLATGLGPDGPLIAGTATQLAARTDDRWVVMGWHEVERGAWRATTQRFQWTDLHGRSYEVELTDPGRMPMLFRERVQASTLYTVQYDLPVGEVRIVLRRALDASADVRCFAVPSGGADLADPQTAALVVAETDRIRAEYGF